MMRIAGKRRRGRGPAAVQPVGNAGAWCGAARLAALARLGLGGLLAALGGVAVWLWLAEPTTPPRSPSAAGAATRALAVAGRPRAPAEAATPIGAVEGAGHASPSPAGASAKPAASPSLSRPLAADEVAYLTWAEPSMDALGHSVRTLDTLLAAPRLGDAGWQRRVMAELAVFRRLYDEAGAQVSPASLRPMHAHLLAGTAHCYAAATLLQKAIATAQPSFVELAAAEIAQGLLRTQQAEEAEAEVLRKRGLKA